MALAVSLPIYMAIGESDPVEVGRYEPKTEVVGTTVNLTMGKKDLAAALREAANVLDPETD